MYSCPSPVEWNRIYGRLKDWAESRGVTDPPPVPLILGGWAMSSAREKHERWQDTIRWAELHECANLVNGLPASALVRWDRDVPRWRPEEDVEVDDI